MATQASPELFSKTSVLSLLSTVAILATAYVASISLLPRSASPKTHCLFIWHAFDALIHFILEGSFLYNSFFSSATLSTLARETGLKNIASNYLPPNIYFLGDETRLYGSAYGTTPFSALWNEYAKADQRWAGSDLTVISLELLTVFIGGPLALWICDCLRKGKGSAWFWMVVLATGELYGGFMTFAPEWLTGSPNLDTSNWMYLWLYLVFFNMLWVWIPLWILYEAYGTISSALQPPPSSTKTRSKTKKTV